MEEIDLFETPENLPKEVQNVLDEFSEMDCTYITCGYLVAELNKFGYTCDYGLDAEPYNLRKIN